MLVLSVFCTLCYSSVARVQEFLSLLVRMNCFMVMISDKEFLKGVIFTLQDTPFNHCAQKSSKQWMVSNDSSVDFESNNMVLKILEYHFINYPR